MFDLTGKVALVTGGASGIGFSITKALLDNGLKAIAILDINEESSKNACKNIEELYGSNKAIFIKTDITDKDQFDNAFKLTVDAFQNLDIVINCAGIRTENEWEKEVKTNLVGTITGTVLAIKKYLPKFKTGSEAVVLNISSTAAVEIYSAAPVYCATKSAIIGLTESCGSNLYYKNSKVKVMAICPGYTDTPLIRFDDSAFLNKDYKDMFIKEFGKYVVQDVINVSKAAIQVIKEGTSGSIWVVKDNEPAYEIEFVQVKK